MPPAPPLPPAAGAASAPSRISYAWLARRQPAWQRLRELADALQGGGPRTLAADELREIGRLYQQAAVDLAALRPARGAETYAVALNALLARTHGLIYAAPRRRGRDPWRFYRDVYPEVFRSCRGAILLAAAILLLGALAGATLTRQQPAFFAALAPPAVRAAIRHHRMWTTPVLAISPAASSGIMTNNLTVAFAAFALGITGGLGTLYLLFFNGLLVGAIAAACAAAGMSLPLWSFIAPHGVLEIPAICIAGGAGLRLAQGLLFPGAERRGAALVRAATPAVRLLLGVFPLLVVAGLVEGFISARPWPVAGKFALAAALATLMIAWLAGLARSAPPAADLNT